MVLPAEAAPAASSSLSPRAAIVAAVLAIGGLASGAFSIWHPEPDANDEFSYSVIEPVRDEWLPWHVFGGLLTAAGAIALGVAVCLLVRRRGAVLATIGAVVVSIGALAFATGVAAEGVLGYYATEPDALPTETGVAFLQYQNDHFAPIGSVLFPGFILLGVGALLLAIALWRARAVPTWLAVAFAVTNVATSLLPFGAVLDVVNAAFTVTLLAIAWYCWRGVARPGSLAPAGGGTVAPS